MKKNVISFGREPEGKIIHCLRYHDQHYAYVGRATGYASSLTMSSCWDLSSRGAGKTSSSQEPPLRQAPPPPPKKRKTESTFPLQKPRKIRRVAAIDVPAPAQEDADDRGILHLKGRRSQALAAMTSALLLGFYRSLPKGKSPAYHRVQCGTSKSGRPTKINLRPLTMELLIR